MYLTTINKFKNLLVVLYIGRIQRADVANSRAEISELLKDLKPGFSLLTDLSNLTETDRDSAPEIAKVMELCDKSGVNLIVRVIPRPSVDIGLNILSLFHYARRPRMVTCETMEEAAAVLGSKPGDSDAAVV